MARYQVNDAAVARARAMIGGRQYVLDSDWGEVQPTAATGNAYLERHTWEEYAAWHLGLTVGANDHTKARYAFVYGDFRRVATQEGRAGGSRAAAGAGPGRRDRVRDLA
jgi:xanthine/CO dehydrogenase XdhC/CoxF family maturation factor